MKQKSNVKKRILDTASRLFYHQGFNSTGINQIIAEADIAIGSLYKHYQSKSDLLYHYLEQQETEYFANLDDYLKDEKQPLKKLLKLIDYRIKVQEESNCSGCHFIKVNAEIGRGDKKIEQFIVAHKERQRDYIKSLVDEISTVKSFSIEKKALQNSIFLMIEGAVVSASINGNTNDLKEVKKAINQFF
ncbi:TetR/AcrR family transcriptional regulator [Flavobacterium sp. LPB0248]|uniref:TetR/AcrR family transcriptional regulator n=1 Tax=Flavobacterium sp. LPB0248 TaxID=2614441 RepID=UPI0015A57227|nr:TetR/AcrR family transcriptional regulator [Flavobacterium sp. LPB0248]QLC65103.1 TetR/AcrR family transcriptional regulator [Flavobacterium sp. LPB0248]